MPSITEGYTRNEIIQIVLDMVGSNNSKLRNHLTQNIYAFELQFFSLEDWSWAHNRPRCEDEGNVLITIPTQRCYTLNFGAKVPLTMNIEAFTCISEANGRKLIKTDLATVRNNDPEGNQVGRPTFWFPIDMYEVELWPVPNIEETFVIEGKFEPDIFTSDPQLQDSPINIPYKYQDCFLQFVFVKALRFERDPRRKEELLVFKDDLRISINEDNRNLESNLRMKTVNEVMSPPGAYDLNYRLWNTNY